MIYTGRLFTRFASWLLRVTTNVRHRCSVLAVIAVSVLCCAASPAAAQRALGIDVSAYQGNMSSSTWTTIYNGGRQFVFLRASRGGTTGYDRGQGGYPAGNNTASSL